MRARIVLIIVTTIAVTVGLIVGGLGARDVGRTGDPAAAAAPDPPYFSDRIGGTGKPVLIFSAEDWGILCNGGGLDPTKYNASYDAYFTTRAAQGYNGVEVSMFSQTNLAGGLNGPDRDGTMPFTPGLDPTTAPNPTFWARRDYFLQSAAAHGSYVFLNAGTAMLDAGAFTAKWTTAQWQAYGTFLGKRYASRTNLMWILGDDYFGDLDANLTAFEDALRAAGGNQPMSFQGYQETSSRKDIYNGYTGLWGTTHADYNWGYSYNATYDVVEKMGLENNSMKPIPYLFGDGTFLNTALTGISSDDFARRMIWWALSSGSKGFNLGDNDVWPWGTTAQAEIASAPFYNNQVPAITKYWRALPGWQRLIADTSSQLVTGGRGTHVAPIVSGGSGTYLSDDSDSYVTAARTPDGSLAVIYMSHPSTITINQPMMVPGYRATWVDPASGRTMAATPGSTYSSSSRPANSAGDHDWALVLQAAGPPPTTTPPPTTPPPTTPPPTSAPPATTPSVTYQGTGHLTVRSWVRGRVAARLRARFAITYACSACGGVQRPITVQGRLRNGSWRAIRTLTYQGPMMLRVRVPYRFRRVRVLAPVLRRSPTISYAWVMSNSVRVPRKPG